MASLGGFGIRSRSLRLVRQESFEAGVPEFFFATTGSRASPMKSSSFLFYIYCLLLGLVRPSFLSFSVQGYIFSISFLNMAFFFPLLYIFDSFSFWVYTFKLFYMTEIRYPFMTPRQIIRVLQKSRVSLESENRMCDNGGIVIFNNVP